MVFLLSFTQQGLQHIFHSTPCLPHVSPMLLIKIFILQYSPVYYYLLPLRAIMCFTRIKKIIAVFHYSVTVSNESIFWKGSTITERHDKQSKFPFTSRSLKSVSRRRRDCSQCLSNSSAAELDFTSSQQNASPCMWQCQRHCARDTDAVISTARVYGNTSVHTDGS